MAEKKFRSIVSLVLTIIMMASLMGMGALADDGDPVAPGGGGDPVPNETTFSVTINLYYANVGGSFEFACSATKDNATKSTFNPATVQLTEFTEFAGLFFQRNGGSTSYTLNKPSYVGLKWGRYEYGLDSSKYDGGKSCAVYLNGRAGGLKADGITAKELAEAAANGGSVSLDYYFTQIVHISVDNGKYGLTSPADIEQIFTSNTPPSVAVRSSLTVGSRTSTGWTLNGVDFPISSGLTVTTNGVAGLTDANGVPASASYKTVGAVQQLWYEFVSKWPILPGSVTINKTCVDKATGATITDGTFTYEIKVGTETHTASIPVGDNSVTVNNLPDGVCTVTETSASVPHYDVDPVTVTVTGNGQTLDAANPSATVTFAATYKTNTVTINLHTTDLDGSSAVTTTNANLSNAELNGINSMKLNDANIFNFGAGVSFFSRVGRMDGITEKTLNYSVGSPSTFGVCVDGYEYGLDGKGSLKVTGNTYDYYFTQIVHYSVDGGPDTSVNKTTEQVFNTNGTAFVKVPVTLSDTTDYKFVEWKLNGNPYDTGDSAYEPEKKVNGFSVDNKGDVKEETNTEGVKELWFRFVSEWDVNSASTNKATITIKPVVDPAVTVTNKFTYTITGTDTHNYTIAPIQVEVDANDTKSVTVIKGNYTVTQTAQPTVAGYTFEKADLNGNGSSMTHLFNTDVPIIATNTYTRDTGSVKITVTQDGAEKDTQDRSYTFTLTDKNGSGTYSKDMTILIGADTGTIDIDNVPTGEYTLTDGAALSKPITVNAGSGTVDLIYTYNATTPGGGANPPPVIVVPPVGPVDPVTPPVDPDDPVDIPDQDVPEGDGPVDIPDGDVPQGDGPVDIGDGSVPRGESPITGDNTLMTLLAMAFLASFSGLVLIWLAATRKKYAKK